MEDDMYLTVGNVRLVVHSLRTKGQPGEESDYIAYAHLIHGDLHSPPIRLAKPGGAEAALEAASSDPWVVEHSGLPE